MNTDRISVRSAALGLLARREHSRRELMTKLRKRAEDQQQLDEVLDQLSEEGLLSDQRFAESYSRSAAGRGHGPARIRRDLQQRGLTSELIAGALEELQVDWYEAALSVRLRRFGLQPPADRKEWAKQARFLLYRGFSQDQVQEALKAVPEEGDGY